MRTRTSTPGEANPSSSGRSATWPTRGSVMSYRSVASRKRAAAKRLQVRATALPTEAAALDGRADELLTANEQP